MWDQGFSPKISYVLQRRLQTERADAESSSCSKWASSLSPAGEALILATQSMGMPVVARVHSGLVESTIW
jgi:hypothetical protein